MKGLQKFLSETQSLLNFSFLFGSLFTITIVFFFNYRFNDMNRSRRRKEPKSKSENSQPDNPEYKVESITDIRIRKEQSGRVVTEFVVKWEGYTERNWEPMENVYKCPLLMKPLQDNYRQQRMLRGLSASQTSNRSITDGIPNFPSSEDCKRNDAITI